VNTKEAPLLLTHICRAWRQVAISTPALWTTFYADETISLPRLPEIADTWFERARKCSLSVKIDGFLTSIDDMTTLETLRRHSREILSLELYMEMGDLERMSTHPPLDLPLLRKLSIWLFDKESEEHDPMGMFTNVPLLHEVMLTEVPPSFVLLPWQQLTKFTGACYSLGECLKALHLMSNLIDCAFSIVDPYDEDGFEVFSHPNIQHFTLGPSEFPSNSGAFNAQVFQFLTLPVLRSLQIQGILDLDPTVLRGFLLRSSPPLQKLSIRPYISPYMSPEGTTSLDLSSPFTMPALTDLEILSPEGDFLSTFVQSLSFTGFLPKLQNLSFLGCPVVGGKASVHDILRIAAAPITARRNIVEGCAQLQSFRVESEKRLGMCISANYPEEALLPFTELKASGMDIYVGTEMESVI